MKALHFLRYLEFNITGIIRTQVNLSHNALDPLLRGCFTYLFLSAKAMFSGDQQFVSILQSVLTNFDLKAVDYDFTKARHQLTNCASALGPSRLPANLISLVLRNFMKDAGSEFMNRLTSNLHTDEVKTKTPDHGPAFEHLLQLLDTLESSWMSENRQLGFESRTQTTAFPALLDKKRTTSLTADQREQAWRNWYNNQKKKFETRTGRPFKSFTDFKKETKCYHCGKSGCYGTICPSKLRGEPAAAGAKRLRARSRDHRSTNNLTNSHREARALLAATETENTLALLASGGEISELDIPEIHCHLAEETDDPTGEPTDNSPSTDETPDTANYEEVFAGIAASVGLQPRGQRDQAFLDAFDDAAALYGSIDDGDDVSHGTFGDFQ